MDFTRHSGKGEVNKREWSQANFERMENCRKKIIQFDKQIQKAIEKLENDGIPEGYIENHRKTHKNLKKSVPDIFPAKGYAGNTSASFSKIRPDSTYLDNLETVTTNMENLLKALDKLPLQFEFDQFKDQSHQLQHTAHDLIVRQNDTIERLQRANSLLEGVTKAANEELIEKGQEVTDLTHENTQLQARIKELERQLAQSTLENRKPEDGITQQKELEEQLAQSTLENRKLQGWLTQQAEELQARDQTNASLVQRLRTLALRTTPEKSAIKDPSTAIPSKRKNVQFLETVTSNEEEMDDYRKTLEVLQINRRAVKKSLQGYLASKISIEEQIKDIKSDIEREHYDGYYTNKETYEENRTQSLESIRQVSQDNPEKLEEVIQASYQPLEMDLKQMRGFFTEEQLKEVNDEVAENRESVIGYFSSFISREDLVQKIDEIDKMYEESDRIQYRLVIPSRIEEAISTHQGLISLDGQLKATETKIEELKKQRQEIEEQLKNKRHDYYNRPEHLTASSVTESSTTYETDEEEDYSSETSSSDSGKEDPQKVRKALKSRDKDE